MNGIYRQYNAWCVLCRHMAEKSTDSVTAWQMRNVNVYISALIFRLRCDVSNIMKYTNESTRRPLLLSSNNHCIYSILRRQNIMASTVLGRMMKVERSIILSFDVLAVWPRWNNSTCWSINWMHMSNLVVILPFLSENDNLSRDNARREKWNMRPW